MPAPPHSLDASLPALPRPEVRAAAVEAAPPRRGRLLLALKLMVAAGLLAWLVASGRLELGRLARAAASAEMGLLLALVLASQALPAWRWWWLLRVQQLRVPFRTVLGLTWFGYFATLVLPGAASGDLARAVLILQGQSRDRARALSTVLADRALGLYSLVCLGGLSALALLAGGQAPAVVRTLAAPLVALFAGLTLAGAALLFGPSRSRLLRVLPSRWRPAWEESFTFYRHGWADLLGCFALSLAGTALTIAAFVVAARLLGQPLTMGESFLVAPLVILANCLPLTPGGVGVAETVAHGLYAALGCACGAEIMALVRVCGALCSLPGVAGMWAAPRAALEDAP